VVNFPFICSNIPAAPADEYMSLSWSNVRLHEDRLHEFSYPLSSLCRECTL